MTIRAGHERGRSEDPATDRRVGSHLRRPVSLDRIQTVVGLGMKEGAAELAPPSSLEHEGQLETFPNACSYFLLGL